MGLRIFKYAVVVLAVVAVGFVAFGLRRHEQPGQTEAGQLSAERRALEPPEAVVAVVAPKPDATVLDLGAGFGMFTFPLAEAVPDGRVVAAEVHAAALEHLRKRINRYHISNVDVLRVKPNRVDEAYGWYAFDVVFASDVMPFLRDHRAFFDDLRPRLKADTGRLWVVELRLDADFTAAEFPDAATLRRTLAGKDTAFLARLGEEVRRAVNDSSVSDDAVRGLTVDALNRLLDEPGLWREAEAWPLNRREAEVRRRLAALGQPRPLRMLNRLMLQDMLATDRWEKAFSLDRFDTDGWALLLASAWLDWPELFRRAGFELVCEHKALPYHAVLEFKRAR